MKNRYFWLSMLLLLLVGCGNTNIYNNDSTSHAEVVSTESTKLDEYILINNFVNPTNTFITITRIHEDVPEFTFIRTISNYYTNYYAFPMAAEVSIKIKDGDGNVIQAITGLTQSIQGGNTRDITFDDYNFDGFLDMRLTRWQDGAGGLLLNEYFWLWDNYSFQFVLNEELMNIGRAADLFAHQELQQIMIWQRIAAMGVGIAFKWHDEKLVAVGYYTTLCPYDYQYFWDRLEATLHRYGLVRTPSWQEAYAEILRYYYANVLPPEDWLDWLFFIHDVDNDNVPELFIVYLAAGVWSEAIYTFADGVLMPIEGNFFAYWGIYPPINQDGIIINAYGRYDLMVIHNGELVAELAFRLPFFHDDKQHWYINDIEVTEDEFTKMFKSIMPIWVWDGWYAGERRRIFPSAISEANIREIIKRYIGI